MTQQMVRTIVSPIGILAAVAEDGKLAYLLHMVANAPVIKAMHATGVRFDASEEGVNRDVLTQTTYQLSEYFDGRLKEFRLPLAMTGTLFQRRVWDAIRSIAYGKTVSYQQLAHMAGHPQAVRAVGTACGANPLPIIVPCHRITRHDGSIGKYALGDAAKEKLLNHEQEAIRQLA